MCTVFVHLPKCFNAIFRFWFRLGIFTFICMLGVFFSALPFASCCCCCCSHSTIPRSCSILFHPCNYRIAAIHLFHFMLCVCVFVCVFGFSPFEELCVQMSFDLATSFSHRNHKNTLYDSLFTARMFVFVMQLV